MRDFLGSLYFVKANLEISPIFSAFRVFLKNVKLQQLTCQILSSMDVF